MMKIVLAVGIAALVLLYLAGMTAATVGLWNQEMERLHKRRAQKRAKSTDR